MALGEGGVTRRLLLGVETCVVVAAVAHSTHAWCHFLYFEEKAGNCQAQGTCEEGGLQMGMAERAVISGTGVAVLSLVLLFARQMMIYLGQLPRHVGILYDFVLVTVWLAHLAQLVQSVAAPVSPPASASVSASTAAKANPIDDGNVLNSDGTVVPCWAARGAAIGAVAVCVYTTRLVLDILQACSRLCSARDRMVLLESGRSKIGTDAEMCATAGRGEGRGYGYGYSYRDDEGAPQAMAYSPVLAFFPAD